jgi:hypothetical protein
MAERRSPLWEGATDKTESAGSNPVRSTNQVCLRPFPLFSFFGSGLTLRNAETASLYFRGCRERRVDLALTIRALFKLIIDELF